MSRGVSATATTATVFVSAIYDLGYHEANPYRKPLSHYFQDKTCQWTLSLRPLVLFTEARLVDLIKSKLGHRHDDVVFIVREFRDLKMPRLVRKRRITATAATTSYLTSTPAKDTLGHLQLQWEKFEMIAEVAQMMTQARVLVWADFGLGSVLRDVPESYPEMAMLRAVYPVDKFTCTVINPLSPAEFQDRKTYYERWRYRIAGGFWSVGRQVLADFLSFVRREIAWLRLEQRTPTDEDILGRFVYMFPQHCLFYFGDYGSLVANRMVNFIKYDTTVAAQVMAKAQQFRPEYLQYAATTHVHESAAQIP